MADAAQHTYKFNVSMSCGGCSGAVDRVLKKLEGEFFSCRRRRRARARVGDGWKNGSRAAPAVAHRSHVSQKPNA